MWLDKVSKGEQLQPTTTQSFFFFPWPHHTTQGILAFDQVIKPLPNATGAWNLNCWTTREVCLTETGFQQNNSHSNGEYGLEGRIFQKEDERLN